MPESILQPSTWTREGDVVSLLPSHCPHCDAYYFPPIAGCVACLKQGLEQVPVSERGILYSYSTIWVPRKGYPNPYTVAFVDFPRLNMRVFATLTTNGPFQLGMEMELTHGVLREENGASIVSYMCRAVGGELV